jgi:hypothetical protein
MLLGVVFLAAQMHYCVDVAPQSSNSHICPVCSTAGHAVTTPTVNFAATPAIHRLRIFPQSIPVSAVQLREVAPRGPPTA